MTERLRRHTVSTALLAILGVLPAFAQSPPGGGYGPSLPPAYAAPPTPYVATPGQVGDVCYTGRGNCILLQPQTVGERCRCSIPGFGWRKGVVQP